MNDAAWYMNVLEKATELAFACLKAPTASPGQLRACRLVGHRGAHMGTAFTENTLASFAALEQAGVWGAEMDIRWTRDLVPVISHDADCQRLFGCPLVIAETDFKQLRKQVPQIPGLEEVVSQFGGKLHLMLEIKAEPYPSPQRQAEILRDLLTPIKQVDDYHLLSLDASLFSLFPFVSRECQVIVGILNMAEVSRLALTHQFGGVAGSYPLLTARRRRLHRDMGQKLGAGHIDSRRILLQQIAKETDWIFSNRALELQSYLRNAIRQCDQAGR